MKIAINGKSGRMGTALRDCIAEDTSLQLVQLTEQPDVVIDFSTPSSTLSLLPFAMENQIPLVIGTTGFTGTQLIAITNAAEQTVIVMSPNMSLGINLGIRLVEQLTQFLGDIADIGIAETHHRDKKDAPSGTALRFGQTITGAGYSKDIQYNSLRLADVPGEHRLIFALPGETLEITHRASSRETFARGAIRAARWAVHTESPGLYDMLAVLGLKK